MNLRSSLPCGARALTRRRFAVLALALAAGSARDAAARTALPVPSSLAAELAGALRQGRPLVVMASLHGCPLCDTVRDSHLRPLLAAGQPVVQLELRGTRPVLDFDGQPTSDGDILRAWQVKAAPTLLFFGRGGREAAERLVGASIPDFYGAYLDERLRTARRGLA